MHEALVYLTRVLLIGVGATAFMDCAMLVRKRLFATPSPNYGLVGRWLAYLSFGRFRHDPIDASPPVRGEHLIGWTAHYLIGIAFATLLIAIWGLDWTCRPTIGPALIVGIGSVVAPFFIMQPGMGVGIAGSRTPDPTATRLRSLVTHAIFGMGLYATGLVTTLLGAFHCGALFSGK